MENKDQDEISEALKTLNQSKPLPLNCNPRAKYLYLECKGCGANHFSIEGECRYCGRWSEAPLPNRFRDDEWYKHYERVKMGTFKGIDIFGFMRKSPDSPFARIMKMLYLR